MEAKRHYYIVSFADSKKYRYEYDAPACDGLLEKPHPFEAFEQKLRESLHKEFPGEPVAYYTSAKVTEIDPSHASRYADLPVLDEKSLKEVRDLIAKQIEVAKAAQQLNSDAPWSNV